MCTIIGLVSHKGGVGKSTFSRALALVSAGQGLNTHIADLDFEQQTTFEWVQRRLAAARSPVMSVRVYNKVQDAVRAGADYDLVMDGPARAKAMALEIAQTADLVIQPTRGTLDDLQPAVRMYHELVQHGIPKRKIVFVLHGVLAQREIDEGVEYLTQSGYEVLSGGMFAQRAYGDAQNQGRTILETNFSSLNEQAGRVVVSVIRKVRELLEDDVSERLVASGAKTAA